MEVPGKKLQQTASAIDDNCCQHCCQDGESVRAEGYCTSCKKALCSTCVITHKKEIQSQRICGQSIMPTSIGDKSNDEESYELCEKHPNEFIKLFCSSHDSLICGHCLLFNHRSCNVSLISELCKSENGSVNKDIVDFLTDVDEYASKIKINMNFVTQQSKAEVLKLREYRNDIEMYLEQRMCFLLEKIQHMKTMDETLLDSLKPNCDYMTSKAETLEFRLSCLKSNPAKLFIETKRAQTELAGLRPTLADMNKEKIIHEYRFNKDSITEKLLASKTGLGKIKEKHEAPREKQQHVSSSANEHVLLFAVVVIGIIVHVAFINKGNQTVITSLRFTRDSDIPINGYMMEMLLLPGDRMLLADWSSNKVEMIDMRTNKLMSEVSLPDQPQSMAILPGDRLAVCLKGIGRIQFVKTLGQLSLEDQIKMAGRCSCIGYHNDRLIVSYTTGRIEIINMRGRVMKNIDRTDLSRPWFGFSSYLSVVGEGKAAVIYVSYLSQDIITKLDMDLNILQTFRDPKLTVPTGITAVGNQLLICGWGSNNIMLLDHPSGKITQLLGEVEGIEHPQTVSFNYKQDTMYVTGNKGNLVKVYKAK